MTKKLEIKFDPNQDYQLAAIGSVVRPIQRVTEYVREFTLAMRPSRIFHWGRRSSIVGSWKD